MNSKLKVSLLTVMIIGSSLVGCGTPETAEKPSSTQETQIEQNKMQWMYSNLIDVETQEEVSKRLIAAGISKEKVDIFMEWVKAFNSNVGQAAAFKEGFTLSDASQIDYEDVDLKIDEDATEYYLKMDTNCRITASLLFDDLVEIASYDKEADNYLMFDIEAIDNDPKYEMIKKERQKFITLFNPVEVQEGTDITKHAKKIQEAWQQRGITFKENTGVSLITLFLHDPYENKRFVGHTGLLLQDEEGLLFVEKYASALPYQVTKFNSEQEVVDYLLSRKDIYGDKAEEKPIVMKNTEIISKVEA